MHPDHNVIHSCIITIHCSSSGSQSSAVENSYVPYPGNKSTVCCLQGGFDKCDRNRAQSWRIGIVVYQQSGTETKIMTLTWTKNREQPPCKRRDEYVRNTWQEKWSNEDGMQQLGKQTHNTTINQCTAKTQGKTCFHDKETTPQWSAVLYLSIKIDRYTNKQTNKQMDR